MRPLYHPPVSEISIEAILHALADPVRLRIYAALARGECAQACKEFQHLPEISLPKSTLSQHFRILREAGLVRSERVGVQLNNRTRCAELKPRFGGMIEQIVAAYLLQEAGWPAQQARTSAQKAQRPKPALRRSLKKR